MFLTIVLDVLLKNRADMQECVWACYWAALLIGAGILCQSDTAVAWGTVFFLGLGIPAWLVGTFFDEQIGITSVLLHTVPVTAGFCFLAGRSALPKHAAAGAWLLYFVPFCIAWRFCDPDAMINLSHWSHWPLAGTSSHRLGFYLLLMAVTAILTNLSAQAIGLLLRKQTLAVWRRPGSSARRPRSDARQAGAL